MKSRRRRKNRTAPQIKANGRIDWLVLLPGATPSSLNFQTINLTKIELATSRCPEDDEHPAHFRIQAATMSRSLLRSVLELRTPLTRLPPSFLLPIQSRRPLSSTSTRQDQSTRNIVAEDAIPKPPVAAEHPLTSDDGFPLPQKVGSATPEALYPRQPQTPSPLSPESAQSISQLLPLLKTQPQHYITAHIWGRPYLVQAGDSIRLPFKMPGVLPGDVLRLDRASTLGSRDYTLKGAPFVDERLFECRATVTGTESEPLRIKVKTKRRQRKNKTVRSKHQYTILRVTELKLKGPEAIGL
ncbi:ribosomal protein L21-like protein [Truncatella angustata]|uniref:Large ribosomal subunit protein bL21m n=1 Tax=Truncatella angustata TaxID=152316 RepID=A0A9P8UXN4_9PEZI|nr:ribosomal protein L21-like protein [Truncatella angustata]KAH6660283.1 ribosomal protein L21-like protein [Truncatella angustata]KAH8202677.1 hypothetical protein TruAng_003163 [Truncatella angustata]